MKQYVIIILISLIFILIYKCFFIHSYEYFQTFDQSVCDTLVDSKCYALDGKWCSDATNSKTDKQKWMCANCSICRVVGGTAPEDKRWKDFVKRASENYRGTQNTTVSGKTCQKWTSTKPNWHDRTPSNKKYINKGLGDHNYCRNPDGEPNIWCYTTDGKRSELCVPENHAVGDVASVEEMVRIIQKASENYRGTKNTTLSGKTCQKWTSQTPNTHDRTPTNKTYLNKGLGDHNYCRNPDGDANIWCYTTDGKRSELCVEENYNPITNHLYHPPSYDTTSKLNTLEKTPPEPAEKSHTFDQSVCEEVKDSKCYASDGKWCSDPNFNSTEKGKWMCANCPVCRSVGGTALGNPCSNIPINKLNLTNNEQYKNENRCKQDLIDKKLLFPMKPLIIKQKNDIIYTI